MPENKRFICIHGHFYQPPRENPWLETVETQDSAAPYHDWNERVCAECYAPNGAARIVNQKNHITRIVNNYAHISFNFGPTLLSWLKTNAPRTYRMILDGERRSRNFLGGHSSAMAQAYNHMIMPLANARDRLTQIRWGIADYVSHFGENPEGMWLPETAVDTQTLKLLAENGIKFTVLAPHQCKRVRPLKNGVPNDGTGWTDTPNASIDPTRPYLLRFPSGASIAVFFYDGPTSRAIAFEGLLNSGEALAGRLKAAFNGSPGPQLVHVATDGESYGHHHKYGEMALAYTARLIEQDPDVEPTNYASYLAHFPPEFECEIVDNTSWSCAHGVERWRSNCGCNGGKPWNQKWRAPLRQALDGLRDTLIPLTEKAGAALFKDVWAARDAYIGVILDRSDGSADRFFAAQATHELTENERIRALEIMEMQRNAQLMYTSCGWFFDDISGIETVQVIAYAARVIQLARMIFGRQADAIEPAFLARMADAKSNLPAQGDGARIYRRCVESMALRLEQVAAHYAISSVFSSFTDDTELFCFRVHRISFDIHTSGRARLALGRAHVASGITGVQQSFCFAVLHFGDQNISAAVKAYSEDDAASFEAFAKRAAECVDRADFPEAIRQIDRYFGRVDYSLTSLFSDEQRRIVNLILNSTLWEIENSLSSIYQDHASLLHFLYKTGLPKPPALTLAASFAVNAGLRRVLESEPIDQAQMRSYLALADADEVALDTSELSYVVDQRMKRAMIELQISAGSLEVLDQTLALARTITDLPFELNLWQAQNIWYEILRTSKFTLTALSDEDHPAWEHKFNELGACLHIDTESITADESILVAAGELQPDQMLTH
jgi:alpha-amylase/alpha-mannosidase (GH57 family)